MFRLVLLSLLAVASLLPLLTSSSAPAEPCTNESPHEPILVYEVSGFTLAGPIDLELALYQNGSARLSSATYGPEGKSQTGSVTADQAAQLLGELSQLGGFTLCDQTDMANDVPLSTLTLMRPKTDTRAHTFSWWVGEGSYGPVEQALNQFIASTFPNF